MNSYLVTVTVTLTDRDTSKYSIEIPVQAKTAAHAKRIAHKAASQMCDCYKAARQMCDCYITDLVAERRYENES